MCKAVICNLYIGIYDWLVLVEATKSELTKWRDESEKGDRSKPVQPPPAFVSLTLPAGAFNGFVTEFRETVGLIKKLPNNTPAIGLDLMIARVKGEGLNLQDVQPDFKYEARPDFKLRVTGRMLGFKSSNFY